MVTQNGTQEGGPRRHWAPWLNATLLLAWGCIVSVPRVGSHVEKQRLARLEAQIEERRAIAGEVLAMRRRALMLQQAADRTSSVLECWRTVALATPESVTLTCLTYRHGRDMSIEAGCTRVQDVYDSVAKLGESQLFAEAKLSGPVLDQRTKQHRFSVEMALCGGNE